MTEEERQARSVSRRTMLKRAGAAGAIVWTVPAIQSINMTEALAQVGSHPPQDEGCGNVRISLGGGCGLPNFDGGGGGDSCLAGADPNGPSACGAIVSSTANDGADWVICVASGCRVVSVSVASGSECWTAPGFPVGDPDGPADWDGYTVNGNCVTIKRTTDVNPQGVTVTRNISHVDLVICCGGG